MVCFPRTHHDQGRTQDELQGILDVETVLTPAIAERMEAQDFHVMFLSGVGEIFPYIRSHTILKQPAKHGQGQADGDVLSRGLHPILGERRIAGPVRPAPRRQILPSLQHLLLRSLAQGFHHDPERTLQQTR